MSTYVDYAEYYDVDHQGQIDVPFYREYAEGCGSPVLELACGTGRVLIPLAEAGFDMVGLDQSENMLARCRDKVAERGLEDRVQLFLADMAAYELPRRDFCLAYVPVRSFTHLYTQGTQLACLERTYAHLRPGGLFIVDVYAPDYGRLAQEPEPQTMAWFQTSLK